MIIINRSNIVNEKSNNVDPDQMLQNVVSDQGLHCFTYIVIF